MLLSVGDFAERYGVSENYIYVAIHQGKLPSSIFIKVEREHRRVDVNFFIRRKEFQKNVIYLVQDVYFLLSNYYSDTHIARACVRFGGGNEGSFRDFISNEMFCVIPENITNYKINGTMWRFFRFFRSIQMDLERKFFNFKLEECLDRMM